MKMYENQCKISFLTVRLQQALCRIIIFKWRYMKTYVKWHFWLWDCNKHCAESSFMNEHVWKPMSNDISDIKYVKHQSKITFMISNMLKPNDKLQFWYQIC